MPIYTPGKLTLAKAFTQQSYMWQFPAAYGLWSPANITTALWLDAEDASTVTLDSGAVSQWRDKSGNSRNATQSTATNRPLYTAAAQNSLSALSFDGSNDTLELASTSLFTSGNADIAVFAAYKATDTSYGALLANYSAGAFAIYFGNVVPYLEPWGAYNGANVDVDSGTYALNKNYLISLIRSSGSFTGWTDGSQKNTVANSNSVGGATAWRIGSNTANGEVAGMDLYEIICINSAPSGPVREKLEGYLAHKWGLAANLPSDHPYKTVGPTP